MQQSLLVICLLLSYATSTVCAIRTLQSKNGVLFVTLVGDEASLVMNGNIVQTRVWNDTYLGPTLRLKPGDELQLRLMNELINNTNIHFHGMQVSPVAPADDSLLNLDPGETFTYRVPIPTDHPAGLFYYHSHADMDSEFQVVGGMAGVLIVEGILKPLPALDGIAEDILALSNFVDEKNLENDFVGIRLVNGVEFPEFVVSAGETRFWRFANIAANLYFNITFPREFEAYIIALDGKLQNQATKVDYYVLGPSSRVELLVQFPALSKKMIFDVVSAHVDTGPEGDEYPGIKLFSVLVEPSSNPFTVDISQLDFPAILDLRTLEITRKRTFSFQDGDEDNFFINNQTFSPERVDVVVQIGDVEEWLIENASGELHHFHLHQVPFQVISVNDIPVPFTGYQDTVLMPYINNDDDPNAIPTTVKIIMSFDDPRYVGKFLFHCHILEHEDGGMMAVIEVQAGTDSQSAYSSSVLSSPTASPTSAFTISNSAETISSIETEDRTVSEALPFTPVSMLLNMVALLLLLFLY